MAMVKANAYGHGLVEIAQALNDVDSLAVARTEEARMLRDAGIQRPIVLLEGIFDADGLIEASELACEMVVHCDEQIDLLCQAPANAAFIVWLKLDSGMNRLGFPIERFESLQDSLRRLSSVVELRLMTHYASADESDAHTLRQQIEKMAPVLEAFDGEISLANSPALMRDDVDGVAAGQGKHVTWVRPGISLYGLSPFDNLSAADLGLRPVMNFETRLIATKALAPGDRVGYGGRFIATAAMRIGIAAAGYGDGYPRMLPDGTPIMVDGIACQLVGRVSMDMLAIDLTPVADAAVGSHVQMWGDQLPAETIAKALGTIGYELVTRVADRVHRVIR